MSNKHELIDDEYLLGLIIHIFDAIKKNAALVDNELRAHDSEAFYDNKVTIIYSEIGKTLIDVYKASFLDDANIFNARMSSLIPLIETDSALARIYPEYKKIIEEIQLLLSDIDDTSKTIN